MGGIIIIIGMLSSTLLWADLSNLFIWCLIFISFSLGFLGFIDDLLKITNQGEVKEIILATSSTVEGDATAIFIKDHVKNAKVSRISYGIPIGGELEYVDGTTIARAIQGRIEINVD